MEDVISRYTTALDELNILMTASYYTAEGDTVKRAKQIADDLLSILINAYVLGVQNAAEMLKTALSINVSEMEAAVFAAIDGKTFEDRVVVHVESGSTGRLRTLAESEFHRVYNRAVDDSGKNYARQTQSEVMKRWYTMLDNKVRETHDYLEGVSVPVAEDFYTFDGDHAPYPGGFEKVENNAGCRCTVKLNKR